MHKTSYKNYFAKTVLASSVFSVMPSIVQAGLVPVLLSTSTAVLPDLGQGYLFSNVIPASITLTVSDGYSIGKSFIPLLGLNASVDSLLGVGINDTLAFVGNATVTATIGLQNPIGTITLDGANKTVNFQGNITATTTHFTQDAIANLSDAVILTGEVDNTNGAGTGTLQFQGGGQITGDIGNSNALKLITVNTAGASNKTVELNGSVVKALTLSTNGDATLKLNNAAMVLTGNIVTQTDNQNILDINNATSITGAIGQNNKALNLVNVGLHNNLAINANVFATTTQFKGNNTLTLADGNVITGSVEGAAAGIGSIAFQGGGQITGNIGNNNALGLITVNTGAGVNKQIELNGAIVKVNTLQIIGGGANTSKILLNSASTMDFTGNIITNNNNLDIVNISNSGGTTITGNIGASGKAFNSVFVGQNSDTTLVGNVTATTTEFQGNHTLSLGDGNIVTGSIDSNLAGRGTLQFQGGGRVSGNIGNINALNLIALNTAGGINKTIELNGNVINANAVNFIGTNGSGTTLLLNSPAGMTLAANLSSNHHNLDVINIANSGATIINGDIGSTNNAFNLVKVGQNAATTINGDIYAQTTQFQGNNILNIGNNVDVYSAIDAIAPTTGTLTLLGNTTISGNIGNTNSIALLNLQGVGTTVNFLGDVTAAATNFTGNGTAIMADNKRFYGPVDAAVANQGNLIFSGNTTVDFPIGDAPLNTIVFNGGPGTIAILNKDLYAANTLVNNGGTLLVSTPQTVHGNLAISNGSILSLSTAVTPLTVTGNFNLGAGTTYELDMGNLVAAGAVNDVGIATVDPTAQVRITHVPGFVPGGSATITIVTDGAGGGANLHAIPVISDSLLTHFSTQVNGNLLQLVINANSPIPISCDNLGISNALQVIRSSTSTSGTLLTILNELGAFTDESTLCNALDTLSPIVDSAVLFESFEAQRHSFDLAEERTAKAHFCRLHPHHPSCTKPLAGISAGDITYLEDRVWVRALGQTAHQSERNGIAGYKNNSAGISLGTDALMGDNALIGLAFNWTNLNIHDQKANGKTRVNSYQETLYGAYEFENPLYLHWALGLAYNEYNTERNFFFGNTLLAPSGKYHGWQTGAKAELGYDYLSQPCLHLIPLISLYYSHLALSEYTERGVNTANLQVDNREFNMLLTGAGIKGVMDMPYGRLLYQPEAHLMAYYDWVGDRMQVTSQFVGAGPSFETIGYKPARSMLNLGGSINIFDDSGWGFVARLDLNLKDEYASVLGYVKIAYEW